MFIYIYSYSIMYATPMPINPPPPPLLFTIDGDTIPQTVPKMVKNTMAGCRKHIFLANSQLLLACSGR